MAEWVMRARLDEAGLAGVVEVDSAGTGGWHAGEPADPRAVEVLRARGYRCEHSARQFDDDDFAERDLVIALDGGHARILRRLAPDPEAAAKIRLLRTYDPATSGEPGTPDDRSAVRAWQDGELDVPDPYYDGPEAFGHCLDLVEAACAGLVVEVRAAVAAS
jgi:protein-tyrosine phosphatase